MRTERHNLKAMLYTIDQTKITNLTYSLAYAPWSLA